MTYAYVGLYIENLDKDCWDLVVGAISDSWKQVKLLSYIIPILKIYKGSISMCIYKISAIWQWPKSIEVQNFARHRFIPHSKA